MNRIRDALDVVDIVLGFLSTGGGRADRQLGEYITRALRMKKRFFSEKVGGKSSLHYMRMCTSTTCVFLSFQAREHCTLGHTLSLWETLSVELARRFVLSGHVSD